MPNGPGAGLPSGPVGAGTTAADAPTAPLGPGGPGAFGPGTHARPAGDTAGAHAHPVGDGARGGQARPIGDTAGVHALPAGDAAGVHVGPAGGAAGVHARPTGDTAGVHALPAGDAAGVHVGPAGGAAGVHARPTGDTAGAHAHPAEGAAGVHAHPAGDAAGGQARPGGDTAAFPFAGIPGADPHQHRRGFGGFGGFGNFGGFGGAGGGARGAGGRAGRRVVAGLALAAVALGGGVAGAFAATAMNGDRPVVSSPVLSPASNQSGTTVADVAAAVQPSVVSITAGDAEGSGVILSADGLILTNNHVVSGLGDGGDVTVRFSDGKSARATVKGTDPSTDIAVLQASGVSGLTPAALGDSSKLKVGDSVLAIGSPLGLEGSVTAGIVSALNRTVTVGGDQQQPDLPPGWGRNQDQRAATPTTIGGAIQTDAAINPGNSGGALVNASGQVVGINSAIATNGGDGNIGVGFAIPINTAKQIADQLISDGTVSHAFLGVGVSDAADAAGNAAGGGTAGALVGSVSSGGPAEQAGIRQGDVITKIGDQNVTGADDVIGTVRGHKAGDKVSVTYVRDGQTHTVTVTLAERAEEE
ncbi:putative serine protease PepD [Thermocatellispora tengchongensis]|uniref:Putative serine protease PepD n=1 Tax=Thermocatellispora tengchongensis TaxID=1073253 RepID=A0A840NZ06_9ACTN|nr:trypsin-like peptidase domain-containing protein [Thermocatellispora tengchongensis]MBB5131999.1 putative serine protease PepD [Thermocatellispora tengchongensis]